MFQIWSAEEPGWFHFWNGPAGCRPAGRNQGQSPPSEPGEPPEAAWPSISVAGERPNEL